MFKDLQEWKEAPVDCILFSLYQLQVFHINEIRRGFAGTGEYHLIAPYSGLPSSTRVDYIPIGTPAEIVDQIKKGTTMQVGHEVEVGEPVDKENTRPSRTISSQA